MSWENIKLAHRVGCGEPRLEKKRQVRGVNRNNLPRMSFPALPIIDTQCFQYMQDSRLLYGLLKQQFRIGPASRSLNSLFLAFVEGCLLSLSSHILFPVLMLRKKNLWFSFLFLKGYKPYQIRTLPLWPHLISVPSLKGLSSNVVTSRVRAWTCEFWGKQFIP